MKKVYLDNAATTPIHPKVLEKMLPFLSVNFGNPSSTHSFGREVRVAIEDAREFLADMIGAESSEIYFTSGGTEALNFALSGIMNSAFNDSGKNKLLISNAEHKAGVESAENLSEQGFHVNFISSQPTSEIDYYELQNLVDFNTTLVSAMLVNNETGIINDICMLSNFTITKGSLFLSDAVQAFGKIPVDINKLGVDALTASAHKIGGPKGIGFAYVKNGTPQQSLIKGGGQERNRRGGTENVAGIIGFAEAAKLAREHMSENFEIVLTLNQKMREGLAQISGNKISFIDTDNLSPYILSCTIDPEFFNNDLESTLMFLDINGIAISSGSACTSGTLKPSHVIKAMGKSPEEINGTIRISFSPNNTLEEVEYSIEIFEKLLKQIKK